MLVDKKWITAAALLLLFVLTLSPGHAQEQTKKAYTYSHQDQAKPALDSSAKGYWIINDTSPGADIPNTGQSLFDLIFSEDNAGTLHYQIPFPFNELVEKISSHMQPDAHSINTVRIPIGRSLRRNAAAPDYFNSPRIIVAADAGPGLYGADAGLNLKGRLFLGYQEKSSILEVISYNTQAGRFEFQEVHNYGAGLQPRVSYANRVLCLSCHQNAGPIFSEEPWLETDSNRQIKIRLPRHASSSKIKTEYLPRFDDVWALDYATDRANYFSSSQFIWQQGCRADDGRNAFKSMRCRAAIFSAVLQYHLLDYVDQNSVYFNDWFLPVIERNWMQKWPGGLLIATANIADKNPFSTTDRSKHDPLNPRPPRAKWLTPNTHLLTGIIYQTADFITQADIARIDQFLKTKARINKLPVKRYQSNCSLKRTANIGLKHYLEFNCQQPAISGDKEFSATGSFIVENNRIVDGNINTLDIPGKSANLRFLDLGKASIKFQAGLNSVSIPVKKYETSIGARLFDGTLLRQLEFEWPAGLKEFESVNNQRASLLAVNDMEPLYAAIEQMIVDNEAGKDDTFSSRPFRRHSLLKLLHQKLGMPALNWHQDHFNSKLISKKIHNIGEPEQQYLPFYRHCSSCHSNQGAYPPGFLNGTATQVKQQIRQCAKKIFERLSLWKFKPEDRLVSPMPPSSWLLISGLSETHWLESNDYLKMQAITRTLLTTRDPKPPHIDQASSMCL